MGTYILASIDLYPWWCDAEIDTRGRESEKRYVYRFDRGMCGTPAVWGSKGSGVSGLALNVRKDAAGSLDDVFEDFFGIGVFEVGRRL